MAVVAKPLTTNSKKIVAALRQRVLRLTPDEIGLAPLSDANIIANSIANLMVWGVVIETAHPDAVASLVALGDGSVSLYVSNGTGCIGCGGQREVRQAGADLLQIAASALPLTVATDDTDLPPTGVVRFYLLTRAGLHCKETRLEDISTSDDLLSVLYFSGQRALAAIERTGAGQSLAQEIRIALNDMNIALPGVTALPLESEQGDPPCLSVGNVVRRLRT